MIPLKFKLGISNNLPLQKTVGNYYVCKDTAQVFIDIDENTRLQINDLYTVAELPASPLPNKLYFLNNKLYIYNQGWICLNETTNIIEQGNMKPITSNAVYELVGNIGADKNTITDDTTGKRYSLGILNGALYYREVTE